MARKRKTKVNPELESQIMTDIENRDDIKICKAWIEFKTKLFTHLETADQTVVDLGFESSESKDVHHNFTSDEVLYLTDIAVSPSNNVIFQVPFGDRSKSFSHLEADCVAIIGDSADGDADSESFIDVANRCISEAMGSLGVNTCADFKRNYLMKDENLREILQAPEQYIETVMSSTKARALYATLPGFGKF